jgi:hypothetical protein
MGIMGCDWWSAEPRPHAGVVLGVRSGIDRAVGRDDHPPVRVEGDCARVGMNRRAVAGIRIGEAADRQRPRVDPKCRQSEWRGHNSVTSHIDRVFIVRIDRDGEINRRLLNTVVEGRRRKLGPGRAGISRPEKSGHLVRGQIDDAGGDSPAGAVAIFMTVWLAPWIVPPLCAAPNVCVQVAPLSLLT